MPKTMKSYTLELPDDPDVRELLAGIIVMNTGYIAIRFRDLAPDGVVKRAAVLREMADGLGAPSMLGVPVAIGSGFLLLTFSQEGVAPIPEEFAKLFGMKPERATYKAALSSDELCDLIESLDSILDDGTHPITSVPGGERERLLALRRKLTGVGPATR